MNIAQGKQIHGDYRFIFKDLDQEIFLLDIMILALEICIPRIHENISRLADIHVGDGIQISKGNGLRGDKSLHCFFFKKGTLL